LAEPCRPSPPRARRGPSDHGRSSICREPRPRPLAGARRGRGERSAGARMRQRRPAGRCRSGSYQSGLLAKIRQFRSSRLPSDSARRRAVLRAGRRPRHVSARSISARDSSTTAAAPIPVAARSAGGRHDLLVVPNRLGTSEEERSPTGARPELGHQPGNGVGLLTCDAPRASAIRAAKHAVPTASPC